VRDAAEVRDALERKGISSERDLRRPAHFAVRDPDGTRIDFVQTAD
jgi:hypothetical protein